MRVWWLVLLVAFPTRDAAACIIELEDQAFEPGEPTETISPGPVTVGPARVHVSDGSTRCPALAFIRFSVTASDDTTPADELGYRVQVVGPTFPATQIVDFRYRDLLGDGHVDLHVGLLRGDPFDVDFNLGVSAIDRSGNIGPESIVRVTHEGDGCRSTRHGSFATLVLALGTLGFVRRRRR
jgi:hypothetical protein